MGGGGGGTWKGREGSRWPFGYMAADESGGGGGGGGTVPGTGPARVEGLRTSGPARGDGEYVFAVLARGRALGEAVAERKPGEADWG